MTQPAPVSHDLDIVNIYSQPTHFPGQSVGMKTLCRDHDREAFTALFRTQPGAAHRQRVARYAIALICLCAYQECAEPRSGCTAAEQAEVLKITVGEPTKLSNLAYQNTASLAVSRRGDLAAFYPKPGTGAKFYRTSTDGGRTWGREMDFPPGNAGRMTVALPEGGVLFMTGQASPLAGGDPGEQEASFLVFSDDFLRFKTGMAPVLLPNVVMHTRWARFWPPFDKGKIVALPNGDLLATMYGDLRGDSQYRTMIVRSTDRGRSWTYHASVAYQPDDPDPHFVGGFCGFCEPSLALLANGQLLCVMRTQGTEIPNEYRPIYASWSGDLGKTWSKPEPTTPHLINISPTLAVLDNGVVVCQYGRPGFHVVFSTDHGHTWRDRVSFSHLPEPIITGQFDMIKVSPNRLAAIGSDADGTHVWPIEVERVTVAEPRATLAGRVLDDRGRPIAGARVQRSPNRYAAHDWRAIPTHSGEKPRFAEPFFDPPRVCSTPVLSYHSIDDADGHPTVLTDEQGRFRFDVVSLGETILTVEAQDYAPQHRHVTVETRPLALDFALKPGRRVRGRVTDPAGSPVAGACVVLDSWHTHSDDKGFFHCPAEAPLPDQVAVKIYKRYSKVYTTLDQRLSLASIEEQPIILARTK
jgi:hypothetical protein